MEGASQVVARTARRDRHQGADTTAAAPADATDQGQPDVVERFVLNSQQPTVALFAIMICLVGVMNLIPKKIPDSQTWTDEEIRSVSGFYGPGAIISWTLMGMSMLYDANQASEDGPNAFHWLKYATIIFTSLCALCDAVWRALHMDFGPSYSAALYMSDKGFELGVLLYTIRFFPLRRIAKSAPKTVLPVHEPPSSFSARAAASLHQYKLYPCVAMLSVWLWCRALSNGHDVYMNPVRNPEASILQWDPLLAPWWKPIMALFLFVTTWVINHIMEWKWWDWGLPAGILLSFAMLHSGLFGTPTPLRLTTVNITETDQITALISTLLVLIVQYGRELSFVRLVGRYLMVLYAVKKDSPTPVGTAPVGERIPEMAA